MVMLLFVRLIQNKTRTENDHHPTRWVNLLTNPTDFDTADSKSFVSCTYHHPIDDASPSLTPLTYLQIIAFVTTTATLFSNFL
jgi:hypothetical protein